MAPGCDRFMNTPHAGIRAKELHISAPAPGYSGKPRPLALMEGRGAGGVVTEGRGLRPPVGVATGAGAVQRSFESARRRA